LTTALLWTAGQALCGAVEVAVWIADIIASVG
jgi:hypothetical protein